VKADGNLINSVTRRTERNSALSSISFLILYNPKFQPADYSACHLLLRWYLARLIKPWRWRRYVPTKSRLTLNGPHGVISQKAVLFAGMLCNLTS
jgi:hypothetical protein